MFEYECFFSPALGEIRVLHTMSATDIKYEKGGKADKVPMKLREHFFNWMQMSNKQRKQIMKETYLDKCEVVSYSTSPFTYNIPYLASDGSIVYRYLDSCATVMPQCEAAAITKAVPVCKPKEKNMHLNNSTAIYAIADTDQNKVEILQSALERAYYIQRTELQRKFGLLDDASPETGQEIVDRILDGKYSIKKYSTWNNNETNKIRWHDPAVKEDRDGYNKAEKALDASFHSAQLDISIKPPMDGLAILRAFESATVN